MKSELPIAPLFLFKNGAMNTCWMTIAGDEILKTKRTLATLALKIFFVFESSRWSVIPFAVRGPPGAQTLVIYNAERILEV